MTQEALKLALEWAETHGEIVFAGGGMDAVNKMNSWVTAIKEAIREHAMYEVQRLGQDIEQEPVCPDCKAKVLYECVACSSNNYPPQRTEQNFCQRCGKRTNDIHTCTPPQRTEQEPVKLPCCGYTDASAVKWNPFNRVVQCHNCGQTYTQPQRSESSGKPSAWVGLTNEELTDLFYNTNLGQQSAVSQAVALLKERNS
jgi:hypothetical protein